MIEARIVAQVDVIGVFEGQTGPSDTLNAIKGVAGMDPGAEITVVVNGERYFVERVVLVHEADTARGGEAERNTVEVHLSA